MSKNKTKIARREVKRKAQKKQTNFAKAEKPTGVTKPTTSIKPLKKPGQKPLKGDGPDTTDPKPAVHVQPSQQKHDIPFGTYDNILLVGEGDFSFTRSLAIEHGCANVVGTSYDSEEEVRSKYPTFESISKDLSDLTPPVPLHHSIDAQKLSSYKHLRPVGEKDEDPEQDGYVQGKTKQQSWDTICFQFPHTGGLSTDVNRQVRANQALISAFFHSCLEKAVPKAAPSSVTGPKYVPEPHPESARALNPNLAPMGAPRIPAKPTKNRGTKVPFLKPNGRVILTLFESEPYTLWNVRDLARHAGLRVVESYRFNFADYPGYSHVRTLGAIEGGGGWKGEDRGSRMYIFEKPEEEKPKREKGKKGERVGNVGKKMGEGWRTHRDLEEVGSESE